MTSILVVLNPSAGTSNSRIEVVRDLARWHSAQVTSTAELPDRLHELLDGEPLRLIVCGGDGSISRAINAVGTRLSEVELGIVPFGTGNDLARSLDLATLDVESAFTRAAIHEPIGIDLVRFRTDHESFFLNAATAGFGAEVTAAVTYLDKQLWGAFAYWLTATTKLPDMHEFQVELVVDDELLQLQCLGLTIANGRFVGGGFPISPQATLDDGFFDLVVIPRLSTVELISAGINYTLNWDAASAGVITRRARSVAIRANPVLPFSFDGEPTQLMDATFEIAPRLLRVVAGERPAIEQK